MSGLFLGADGGGTKTALCLVDGDGALLASLVAPSTYYLGDPEGPAVVGRVLADAVAGLCAEAGVRPQDVDRAFFALPGYGEVSGDLAALDAAPRAALGHDRYDCGNDMVAGWAGSLSGGDGVNVICGTGSMAYGERKGTGARVGGWGELFGDEGSGYWIGIEGLRAFARMADGRCPPGPLLAVLREHLHLAGDLDAVDVVLGRWRGERRRVAALSRPVVRAARAGDAACRTILAEAARELALLVATARERIGFPEEEVVPVSYSGGVFAAPEVREGFARELGRLAGPADLRAPEHPPVVGAALVAARRAGAPLGVAALARLRGAAGEVRTP